MNYSSNDFVLFPLQPSRLHPLDINFATIQRNYDLARFILNSITRPQLGSKGASKGVSSRDGGEENQIMDSWKMHLICVPFAWLCIPPPHTTCSQCGGEFHPHISGARLRWPRLMLSCSSKEQKIPSHLTGSCSPSLELKLEKIPQRSGTNEALKFYVFQ
jgi:hypothetical protein